MQQATRTIRDKLTTSHHITNARNSVSTRVATKEQSLTISPTLTSNLTTYVQF